MNYDTYLNGVWKLDFRSASDGFVKEQNMMVDDAETQMLHADISCETVPDGASLTLWLVQGDVSKSFDVTNLSDPLEYSLSEFALTHCVLSTRTTVLPCQLGILFHVES